jgi:hypothetical protein
MRPSVTWVMALRLAKFVEGVKTVSLGFTPSRLLSL